MGEKKRVVILGGGLAGLSTAWALVGPHNHHADDFDVTILERGWSLGGKAASTRSSQCGERIEEHGIHLFLGFYIHAFRMMRDVYQNSGLDRDGLHPLTCVENAFAPQQLATTFEFDRPRAYQRWDIAFPADDALCPWDWKDDAPPEISLSVLVRRLVDWLGEAFDAPQEDELPLWLQLIRSATRTLGEGWGMLRREVRDELHRLSNELREFAILGERRSHRESAMIDKSREVHRKVHIFTESARQLAAPEDETVAAQRFAMIVELGTSVIRGLLVDGIVSGEQTFEDLDDEELRSWLRRHGCSEKATRAVVLDVYYHLAFAYQDGSAAFDKRNTGAGSAIRALLLMVFGYRGAFMYRMKLGMGEAIVLPIYLALKKRGVKFRFFSDVNEIGCDGSSITSVRFRQQIEVAGGPHAYQPLRRSSDGILFWPAEPDFSQLVDGDALAAGPESGVGFNLNSSINSWTGGKDIEWVAGTDFDEVVLAISVQALPALTRQLTDQFVEWREMLENLATVPTRAAQLWLNETAHRAGWERVVKGDMGVAELAVSTGFDEPFDTWVDMSHLLVEEEWNVRVRQSSYLCSAAPPPPEMPTDELGQQALDAAVREDVFRWLDREGMRVWPNANEPGTSRFDRRMFVHDPATGEPDFDAGIYSRYNVDPSDRYVQTLAGTTRYRLAARELPIDNLTLAGDWTNNALNVGCVEATVLSGVAAAHALGVEYMPIAWDRMLTGRSTLPRSVWTPPREVTPREPRQTVTPLHVFPRIAQPELRPRYELSDIMQYIFAAPAEQRRMQALVDERINSLLSPSIRYTVSGHHCFVQCQRIDSMRSDVDAPDIAFSQDEIALVLLVERRERRRDDHYAPVKNGLRYYCPLLFNNSPQGVISGRAIFGFDKRDGRIEAETVDGFPTDWRVFTDLYREGGARPDHAEAIRLRDVSPVPEAPEESWLALARWFLRYLRFDARADWRSLFSTTIPLINVRTTSDPSGNTADLRRELIECGFDVMIGRGVSGGRLSRNWRIQLDPMFAASVRETFGARFGPDHELRLDGNGVWLRYSAELADGRILSTRSGAPTHD